MRILLVVPMVPSADGAGAIPMLLHAQLTGLASEHELTLVTAFGDEPGESRAAERLRAETDIEAHVADRRRPQSVRGRWRRRRQLAGSWLTSGRPWRTVWFADPGIQDEIDRLAGSRDFDVVAVEDSSMSVFRLPAGVPTVLTEHEAHRAPAPDWRQGPLWSLPGRVLAAQDWRRLDRFQRRAWSDFDRIQVFSRGDAETIAAAAPETADRLTVNPFGIELPRASDPARQEPDTVLFVGNFTHPPNRDAAIWLATAIMPTVRRRAPRARLRIVGTAPPESVLALRGEVVEVIADAPAVEPHLEAAAVVLAPVRTGGGMRMKVLEAMARGKAVVTTSLGAEGFTEVGEPPLRIGDGAPEIATATAELLSDPEARGDLGLRARAFAERHFSPPAWARRLTRVYEDAIAGAGD